MRDRERIRKEKKGEIDERESDTYCWEIPHLLPHSASESGKITF